MKLWPLRRLVQLAVLALLLGLPVVSRYRHYLTTRDLEKKMELWEGTVPGRSLQTVDTLLRTGIPDGEGGVPTRHPRKAVLKRSHEFTGSPWSMRLFGVSFTDLLAGAESWLAARSFTEVLLAGLTLPLLATLLLGRVFCSWICPMGFLFELGEKLRGVARWLELPPMNLQFWRGNKFVLLGVGLAAVFFAGIPLLHTIYPPAMLSREGHNWVMSAFDRAEADKAGFSLSGLTGVSLVLLIMLAADIWVAPRFWCRTLCPGGALYALLGSLRLLRVRRDASTCSPCGQCDKACPMALKPMTDKTGIECDNCGECIDICPENALHFRVAMHGKPMGSAPGKDSGKSAAAVLLLAGLLLFVFGRTAFAHHIMGLPHYAYDEDYPQAPVLKLTEQVGSWDFQLTGYPGNPEPGNRTEMHVYVVDTQTRALYRGDLRLDVRRSAMVGNGDLIFGPEIAVLSENLFKLYPTYPDEGNYVITLEFQDGDIVSTLQFPMVVGEPGSPWTTLLIFGGGIGLLLIVVRAARIKRARALELRPA